MRGAAPRVRLPGLAEACLPVHGQAHLIGVRIVLAVVLPPADRAQSQAFRRVNCLVSATWAAILSHGILGSIDGGVAKQITAVPVGSYAGQHRSVGTMAG